MYAKETQNHLDTARTQIDTLVGAVPDEKDRPVVRAGLEFVLALVAACLEQSAINARFPGTRTPPSRVRR